METKCEFAFPGGNLTCQRIHNDFNRIVQSTYNFTTILNLSLYVFINPSTVEAIFFQNTRLKDF